MSYTHSREEAAIMLEVSTRTLDRYVKSGKIRAKRKGKMIYLHDDDVSFLRSGEPELVRPTDSSRSQKNSRSSGLETPEVIIFDDQQNSGFTRKSVVDYRDLYEEAMKRLSDKDRVIQDLSYRAGHAESELKNSVSMIEYKKQTFLLESAKAKTDEDIKLAQAEVVKLKSEVMESKFVLYLLISLVCVLLILSAVLLYFLI